MKCRFNRVWVTSRTNLENVTWGDMFRLFQTFLQSVYTCTDSYCRVQVTLFYARFTYISTLDVTNLTQKPSYKLQSVLGDFAGMIGVLMGVDIGLKSFDSLR